MSESSESSLITFWENIFKALSGGMHATFPLEAIPLCINNSVFIKPEGVSVPVQQMHKYFLCQVATGKRTETSILDLELLCEVRGAALSGIVSSLSFCPRNNYCMQSKSVLIEKIESRLSKLVFFAKKEPCL